MTIESLDQGLSTWPVSRDCLFSSRGVWTIGDLRDRAADLRERSRIVTGGRIALCGLDQGEFIEAITAFDGMASTMVLLPRSLDASTRDELIRLAGCTHRLDGAQRSLIALDHAVDAIADPAVTRWVLSTSGTTGTPKLIAHTLASLSRTVKRDPQRGGDYHWGLLYDPSRFAGLQVVLQALLGGSQLTLPAGDAFHDQVRSFVENPVNALSATPSLWRKLLMDGRIRKQRLRQVTLGGEIADQAILDALRQSFPTARLTHIYASTEAGSGFAVNDGLAGFPLDWIEREGGPIPMRLDNRGHLLVRPPIFATGEAVMSRLDESGYLDTEDLVTIQGDRVLFCGRASGAINVGGNKVNPEHVEQFLRTVPGIQDVKVYPKKSSVVGQLVAADVVATDGEESSLLRRRILDQCRGVLESWQIPAVIRFVPDLAINAAGKVERRIR